MRHVANKIQKVREDRGLSLRELADEAGISFGYLSDIENGKADPTVRELELICHGLGEGTTLHDLLEEHEDDFLGFGDHYGDPDNKEHRGE